MATGDLPTRSSFDNVQSILNIFRGTPGSTQTTTSAEDVSNDKAKSYIQQILESNSGLAAVSSGQKAAGLYGSTVNQQLTNDLLARTAAATAALSARKTSSSTVKNAPSANFGKTLLTTALGQLLAPTAKAASKKLGLNDLGDKISDSIFGGSPGADAVSNAMNMPNMSTLSADSLTIPVDDSKISDLSDLNGMKTTDTSGGVSASDLATSAMLTSSLGGGGAAAAGADASYAVSAGATGTFATSDAAAAEATAAFDSGVGSSAGAGASAAAGDAAAAEGAGGASAGASAGIGAIAVNDMLNLQDTFSNGSDAEKIGTMLLGPQGGPLVKAIQSGNPFDALGPTGGLSEDVVKAVTPGWIICTELNKQGRLPHRYYVHGAREFARYDTQGKQGYYLWAIPSVKHLRKHPDSVYSKLLEVVFNARAEYLSAIAGCKGAKKTVLGAITTHGLYGFCWLLSRTLARKPYSQEQILEIGA